jgi:dolichol-phosphate mannosyltransferase
LSFSERPLKVAVTFGLLVTLSSIIMSIWLIFGALNFNFSVLGWPSIMTSIFFLGGSILTVLGIIGIYLGRVFNQVKSRPLYIVDKVTTKI